VAFRPRGGGASTSQGRSYGIFQKAIQRRNVIAAVAAARELPQLSLLDALELTDHVRVGDRRHQHVATGQERGRGEQEVERRAQGAADDPRARPGAGKCGCAPPAGPRKDTRQRRVEQVTRRQVEPVTGVQQATSSTMMKLDRRACDKRSANAQRVSCGCTIADLVSRLDAVKCRKPLDPLLRVVYSY
jgi:hypothetical protein